MAMDRDAFWLNVRPFLFPKITQYYIETTSESFRTCIPWWCFDIQHFSNDLEEHLTHVDTVLTLLNDNSIRLRLSKCFFAKNELEYLGHMVSGEGLRPTNSKIKSVTKWPTPKSIQNVQQWVGFCIFYRRYIRNYSKIAAPLYQLTKKDKAEFVWTT